jgi:hypothetical protein
MSDEHAGAQAEAKLRQLGGYVGCSLMRVIIVGRASASRRA